MGQLITFEQAPSASDSSHIYTLNRSLTGMEIITYDSTDAPVDTNNAGDVLAHRLLQIGADTVSIYSNVVTINCDATKFEAIKPTIEQDIANLFNYYGDGAGWSVEALDGLK